MGISFLAVSCVTFLLVGGLAIWSAPDVLSQTTLGGQGIVCVGVFILGSTLRAYIGRHISFLFASGRIALLRWIEAAYWSVAFIGAALALFLDAQFVTLVLAYQIPLGLGLLWTVWVTRQFQATQEGFDTSATFQKAIIVQLWPSFWRSMLGTSLLLVTQSASLYYAKIGKPGDVAAYLFAMSLMRPMIQFTQVPFFTILPRLAQLQASGLTEDQIAIAAKAMRLSLLLLTGVSLAIAVALAGINALELSETHVPSRLWMIICIAALIDRVGAMHLQFYSSTNHILWHWANGITALIFLGLAALFLEPLGLYAFPLAQLIALCLFYTPFSMVWSYRAFALDWPGFELRTAALPLAILLAYAGAVLWGGAG